MRKPRILFCSEATFLHTGYATYTREILKYLYSTEKYEIAELASYGEVDDPRAKDIPWKFYGVSPGPKASKEEQDKYHANPLNQFGEYIFEEVCLNFQPDVVCDIRDFWMLDFQERSPFRKLFHWLIMPTVDAAPQARQWISTYQSADACLTYSEWSGKVLQDQSGDQINYLGTSPPSAHPAYQPMDKAQCRNDLGIDVDVKMIGTVMRNQRRKLYPDLFKTFKSLLDAGAKNTYLYCHTSYPDLGWDIPELLQEYELSSHVYFTYVCTETNKPFASLFKGAKTQSPFTGNFAAVLSNVQHGLSYEDLARVMNCFDVYVQYANSEGFGLPQVEAAACGIPLMSVDYSAMSSVVRKLGGVCLTPKALYKELETGCFRAVPDNDESARKLKEFFDSTPEDKKAFSERVRANFLKHYQWEDSGKAWEKYIDTIDVSSNRYIDTPLDIKKPAEMPSDESIKQITPSSMVYWLIVNVLVKPEMVHSFLAQRLIRDLTYQNVTAAVAGMYENEMSAMTFGGQNKREVFTFKQAYNHCLNIRNKINFWEDRRRKVLGL
jgi:glycosyltransferase involved in cell wall biosynthesis